MANLKNGLWVLLLGILTGCGQSDDAADSNDANVEATTDSQTTAEVDSISDTTESGQLYDVTIEYTTGPIVATTGPVIYAIWIENEDAGYIKPLYVCERLVNGFNLTDTALPYWMINKKSITAAADIDAVTGATVRNADFTVSQTITIPAVNDVTVYVELDHSFDQNDWFTDGTHGQPAILYAATFSMSALETDTPVDMTFIGWTPNEGNENDIPNTPMGILQSETRYITHHKDGNGFGDPDDRSATNMVGTLTAAIVAH